MAQPPYTPCPQCAQNGLRVPLLKFPKDTPACPVCAQNGMARPLERVDESIDPTDQCYVGVWICASPRCPCPRMGIKETTDFGCVQCGHMKQVPHKAGSQRGYRTREGVVILPPDMPQTVPSNEEIMRSNIGAGPG